MSRQLHGQLASEFNPFGEDYLAEILEAVAVAWSRMKQPNRNEWEDPITYRLAGRLQNDPIFNELPYDIVPQHWLLGLNGERLGRLDLRFKHRQSQRDYFAFESKRLHVTYPGGSISPEYGDYAGEPGMMAFIEGQYSKSLPDGGMLGYVMDGDTSKAWSGLATRIEARRQELKLGASSKLTKSKLSHIEASGMLGTLLGETAHQIGYKLRLFHLLLPVAK
jgi:hypothetical protein